MRRTVLSLVLTAAVVATANEPTSADRTAHLTSTGRLRALKQDWPRAEAAFRDAIEIDRFSADAWHGLAGTLLGQGDVGNAAAAWTEALLLDPDHAAALEALGRLEARRGHVGAARELLDRLRPIDASRAATLRHEVAAAERAEN